MPFSKLVKTLKKPLSKAYPKELKTIGYHLRKTRLDRGLLQKDVAKLIGFTEDCITNWENNRVKPYRKSITSIEKFLGYLP